MKSDAKAITNRGWWVHPTGLLDWLFRVLVLDGYSGAFSICKLEKWVRNFRSQKLTL